VQSLQGTSSSLQLPSVCATSHFLPLSVHFTSHCGSKVAAYVKKESKFFSSVVSFQRTLSRYFDVTHATAQLSPTAISKWNTGMQLLLVATTLAAPVFSFEDHAILHIMWYVGRLLSPGLMQVTA